MIFRKLRCSFCHRDESQVAKLVAGPRVYICDRCAYETVRIMETTPPGDAAPVTRRSIWHRAIEWVRPSRREPMGYGLQTPGFPKSLLE